MVLYPGLYNRSGDQSDTFGGCPECGQSTGHTHSGRKRWIYCAVHKTRWSGGEVLSCHWKIEISQESARDEAEVNSYCEVEPLPPAYPAALKAELEMTDQELAQHLRVLALQIEQGAELQFRRMLGEG